MGLTEKQFAHLEGRFSDLEQMKSDGGKIIGYGAGGYVPEELLLACDAVPLGFIRSADHSVIDMAGAYICRWFDPFVRTQIGLALKGEDPYYKIVDLLVMANTDNHVRALIDVLCAYSNINIFTYGVPHRKNQAALAYYLHGITKLKKRVEELTGVEITDARLREAIKLCNRERELLKEISLMRRSSPGIIASKDFVKLNHASF